MGRRRAFETSLVAAIALHVAAIGLIAQGKRNAPHAAPDRQTQEVEIETMVEAPPTTAPVRAANGTAGSRLARLGRMRPTRAAAEVAPAVAEPEATDVAPVAPPTDAPPATATAKHAGLDQLGIGLTNPLLGAPAGAADRAQGGNVAPGIARSLAEGVAEREARIGLGPQGPVVGALEAVATRAPGPMNGHALFSATIDSSGKLLGIDVLSASSDFASWQAVARRAAASIAKRRLRKPAGGRAVRLTIAVEARERMPSGADPGLAVDLAGIPIKKGKGKRSARISILPLPKAERIHVATPGGVYDMPWVTAPIPGLAVAGDLSDIGAVSRRLVHAHLVSTSVL